MWHFKGLVFPALMLLPAAGAAAQDVLSPAAVPYRPGDSS